METPNTVQNKITGRSASTVPMPWKCSSQSRCPNWNTHTTAPKLASSESVLTTTALSGSSTLRSNMSSTR